MGGQAGATGLHRSKGNYQSFVQRIVVDKLQSVGYVGGAVVKSISVGMTIRRETTKRTETASQEGFLCADVKHPTGTPQVGRLASCVHSMEYDSTPLVQKYMDSRQRQHTNVLASCI